MSRTRKKDGRVKVVNDTGAIISGLPRRLPAEHYTTSLVVEEVKDRESAKLLEELVALGMLSIVDPEESYLTRAMKAARKAGVHERLSKTDISVLALAIMLGGDVYVATDDYSLQRAVERAGLKFIPIRYPGYRSKRRDRLQ